MRVTTNKLSELEDALSSAKDKLLRQRGWTYTSDNPASTWLWQKALPDGRIVVVDRDTAIHMQCMADSISLAHWPKA